MSNVEGCTTNPVLRMIILCLLVMSVLCSDTLHAGDLPTPDREVTTGKISGQLMIKGGGPMAGGVVHFFSDNAGPPPTPEKYWRVPDHIALIEDDGRFSVELPMGNYYIGATMKVNGEEVGPPQEGDYFFTSRDKEGKQMLHEVKAGDKIDFGSIPGGIPFMLEMAEGITGVEGTISNKDGEPVEGAIVFAYKTDTMTGPPLFVSERTGSDGKYLLRVNKGGKYYLRVRDVYGGGPPHGGALISGYRAIAVSLKQGTIITGIDIKVMRRF